MVEIEVAFGSPGQAVKADVQILRHAPEHSPRPSGPRARTRPPGTRYRPRSSLSTYRSSPRYSRPMTIESCGKRQQLHAGACTAPAASGSKTNTASRPPTNSRPCAVGLHRPCKRRSRDRSISTAFSRGRPAGASCPAAGRRPARAALRGPDAALFLTVDGLRPAPSSIARRTATGRPSISSARRACPCSIGASPRLMRHEPSSRRRSPAPFHQPAERQPAGHRGLPLRRYRLIRVELAVDSRAAPDCPRIASPGRAIFRRKC